MVPNYIYDPPICVYKSLFITSSIIVRRQVYLWYFVSLESFMVVLLIVNVC